MDNATAKELRDRMRRIETRLTRFLEQSGFETQVQRPVWGDGVIHAPTSNVSIRDCLTVVPPTWDTRQPITVLVKDDVLTHLYLRACR